MTSRANHRLVLLISLLVLAIAKQTRGEDTFLDRIAPILETKCVGCHNDAQLAGDVSLQSAFSALASGAIQPGDPNGSHLIDLIASKNGIAEMPKDAEPLSQEEVDLIRNWIAAGADWPEDRRLETPHLRNFDWWSLQPLTKPSVPESSDDWVRTPIDAFVLQQLQQQGLEYSEEADRRTLMRRLSFDLLGLPPTPEEVDAFVADPDPRAYEKLVDRFLKSEHYGERWARHWLDIVKYADTCGYDKDKLRENAWPYRDYVIRSFNEDKPFNQFVQEQIAGDTLFPGEPDGILGLGFIAAGPWDFIGHVEVAESKIDGKVARNLDRDDMVSNAINTFCSVTIQCARCHDHKFDPFTQQHYYGLQAIFAAVDRAERPFDSNPETAAKREVLELQRKQQKASLAAVEREIDDAGGEALTNLRTEVAKLQSEAEILKAPEFGYHSAIAAESNANKWVEVQLKTPINISQVVLHACHDDYAGIGAGFGFPVRFKIEVASSDANDNAQDDARWQTIADHTTEDFPNPGLRPVAIECSGTEVHRVRITATQLAERKDDFILALAELELFDEHAQAIDLSSTAIVAALDSTEAPVRWSKLNLIDGKWARTHSAENAAQLAAASQRLDALLAQVETPERVKRRQAILQSIAETEAELQTLPQPRLVYAATTDFKPEGNFKPTGGKPRPIHLLIRGEVERPGDEVEPCLLPLREDDQWNIASDLPESERRAALATWLTRPEHPLVWRSIVNRIWQYHFGEGIVATPNDFGRMGAIPTHPELLDWLACEFRDNGQSFKELHRLMVTSSVYRQQAAYDNANATIDGNNRFLWRMNRRRLEAEEIRDSILQVSGTLDKTMGGPGYYLFELERPEHSPHYEYHKFDPSDPASHRRSIYQFLVRSQPNPWMTTLDCADSSQSTPRRNETLTSLQALSLLNNRFNLVMAERFAQRLEQEADTLEAQVDLAMRLVVQRVSTREESEALLDFAREHGLPNLCRFLFNLSEFVFVD